MGKDLKDLKAYIKGKIVHIGDKKKLDLSILDELVLENGDYNTVMNCFYEVAKECHAEVIEDFSEVYDGYDFSDIESDVKYYLNSIGKYPLLTKEEEVELFTRYSNGDKSVRDKIVNSNLKWVVSIAKHYVGCGVDFIDLIQEGNLGLLKAVDEFDVTMGYKFSTYSYHWIRQAVRRAVTTKSRTIRIPESIHKEIHNLKKVQSDFSQKNGREATVPELCELLGFSKEKVLSLVFYSMPSASLDVPVGEDEDITLGDMISDENNFLDRLEDVYYIDYIKECIDNKFLTKDRVIVSNDGREKKTIKGTLSMPEQHRNYLLELGKEYQKVINIRLEYGLLKKELFRNSEVMAPIYKSVSNISEEATNEKVAYGRILKSCRAEDIDRKEWPWLDSYLSEHEDEYLLYLKELDKLDEQKEKDIEEVLKSDSVKEANIKVNEIAFSEEMREVYEANIIYIKRNVILHLICSGHPSSDAKKIADYLEKRNRISPPEIYTLASCKEKQYEYINMYIEALQKYNLMVKGELIKFANEVRVVEINPSMEYPNTNFLDNCEKYSEEMKKLRTRDVLYRRLGLNGEIETLNDLGEDYNVTRERIRQIGDKGLRVLKLKIRFPEEEKEPKVLKKQRIDS